jgi:hypothetical protein
MRKIKINIREFLKENGVRFKETSTDEIIIEKCFSCGKTNKLYVEPHVGVFQCKSARCEYMQGGSPIELVKNILDCNGREAFILLFGEQDNVKFANKLEDGLLESSHEAFKKELIKVEWPSEARLLDKSIDIEAYNYLKGRGVTDDDLDMLKVRVIPFHNFKDGWSAMQKKGHTKDDISYNMMYLNRIIFPLLYNDELKGFVARDFTGKVPVGKKVLNSRGNFRTFYYWNYDNSCESEELVICEGIMDAVKCGLHRSLALLGTNNTTEQIDLIKTTKAKKIILAFDPGTDKIQEQLYKKLEIFYLGNIYKLQLPEIRRSKEALLNKEIIEAIEEKTGKKYEWTENQISVGYEAFEEIEEDCYHKRLKLSDANKKLFERFIEHSDYLDAGDMTHEEMDELVKNAVPFHKEDTLKLGF